MEINPWENDATIDSTPNPALEGQLVEVIGTDIYFYSPITDESTFKLITELRRLEDRNIYHYTSNKLQEVPNIRIHINSPGGYAYCTFAIIDTFASLHSKIVTIGEGFCASGASLLLVCGDERWITKNTHVLIHQVRGGAEGTHSEIKDTTYNYDLLDSQILDIYLSHSKLSLKQLETIIRREKNLTAEECLKYKIVDRII